MRPDCPLWRLSRRAQTVTVCHVLPGSDHPGGGPATDPVVRWAGSGYYWAGARAADVLEIDS